MMPRLALVLALVLAGCGSQSAAPPASDPAQRAAPPPMPEGAKTVDFEADEAASKAAQGSQDAQDASGEPGAQQAEPPASSGYWGVEPGKPLPIQWADLMPEGAEEALERQQAEFYAMLDKRYAANTTLLSDVNKVDQTQQIAEGSALDYMPQLGTFDAVADLDGTLIRIPGYVVPLDFDPSKKMSSFLFVPYMGACIHTPPPPPNQIIFVRADPAIKVKDIWAPYWLEGELTVEESRNEAGDAAYALALDKLEPYRGR